MLEFKKLLFLLVLVTFQESFAQGLSKKQERSLSKIDSYLSAEFPSTEPGVIILIAEKGEIVYKKSFGLSNFDTKESLSVADVLPIASMTKQFTAVAILKLVEQNKLNLSDSIQQFIPEFPSKKHTITIADLLGQTSGIREFFDVDEGDYHLLSQAHEPLQIIDYFKADPLAFEPGMQFQYSNSNYVLLGLVIERVSGKTYGEFLEETIFKPLEMTQTSYWYGKTQEKESLPIGYTAANGNFIPSITVHWSIWYSSGGITATVDDLFKWNSALFRGEVLNSDELLRNDVILKDGKNTGYSFGFFLKELQGSPTIQHGGNLYGFTSSGLYLPKEDMYIAILSNRGFKPTEEIANYLGSELLGKPITPPKGISLENGALENYTGTYQLASDQNRIMKIFIVADRLVLSFPEQTGAEVDILPLGNDKFESKKVDVTIEFLRDESGNIKGFTAYQKGKTEWIKLPD